jgi:hypothetical protein
MTPKTSLQVKEVFVLKEKAAYAEHVHGVAGFESTYHGSHHDTHDTHDTTDDVNVNRRQKAYAAVARCSAASGVSRPYGRDPANGARQYALPPPPRGPFLHFL